MRALLFGLVAATSYQPVFAEQVDLLLLYDNFTEDRYNGAPTVTMQSWIDNANAAYADSQVDIQLNLVGLELHNTVSTDMSSTTTHTSHNKPNDKPEQPYVPTTHISPLPSPPLPALCL